MEPTSSSHQHDFSGAAPVERRPIFLRGYVETEPAPERDGRRWRQQPSEFALFFDTETNDDAAQQLRFGCYQLWQGDRSRDRGLFYDPSSVKPSELAALEGIAASRGHRLMTASEFVDRIIYPSAEAGAIIVGFNLPFDISRLAIGHGSARTVRQKDGRADHSMQGGFSFTLSPDPKKGHVRIKHLNRRASFINFARPTAERGFFLDIKTLAAALTSTSHTLDSLAKHLKTKTHKAEFSDYSRDIDGEFISYAIDDVQVTRECYEKLIAEYDKHGLSTRTPATRIYSEASLGKAYLQAMNIRPWRQVQRDFPNEILGAIMSSYFGGRAEVHRRREVVRTVYCDFASMYPTVCTLQQLWRFVIAEGLDWAEETAEAEGFLAECDMSSLQDPATWRHLTTLVKVTPDRDIFPVRAKYGRDAIATIGHNYLSADRGLWFTMADCVASKLLTGKFPQIERAIKFTPRQIQGGLKTINISGNSSYRINPARDDFYKRLIDLRRAVRAQAKATNDPDEAERLEAEQLALKILANATSYGIFIEINVEDEAEEITRTIHTGGKPFSSPGRKLENPGNYFYPLLATLITGAARLMLAITERLAVDTGLDWAFCDTDSMAFTMPPGGTDISDPEFRERVNRVCDWFGPLNPYDQLGSILELEDQNFGIGDKSQQPSLYCYAVSAKRYALFNLDAEGNAIIRKASAHGLGHLYPPYGTEDPDGPERATGVLRWQEDLWVDIVGAALRREPQAVPFGTRPELELPAASRYSATTPAILSWFRQYNEGRPYPEQIRPFGFLTWFHAKHPEQVFHEDDPETAVWDPRAKQARPVAPYDRDISKAAENAFDRETGGPVPRAWLRSYAEALRQYHIHPETKFLGGGHMQAGPLSRRHVFATAVEYIGKEADNWEEDSHFGADEDSAIPYGPAPEDRARMIETIRRAVRVEKVGVRPLRAMARVSDHTLKRLTDGDPTVSGADIVKLYRAAEELVSRKRAEEERIPELLEWARAQPRGWLGMELNYDLSNLAKVLSGKIKPQRVLIRLGELCRGATASERAAKKRD